MENAPKKGHFPIGDLERIRTSDPQLRRLLLYPAELRDHVLSKKPYFYAKVKNCLHKIYIVFPTVFLIFNLKLKHKIYNKSQY